MAVEWDVRRAGRRAVIVTRDAPEQVAAPPVPWEDVAEMVDPVLTETLLAAVRGSGVAVHVDSGVPMSDVLRARIRVQARRIAEGEDLDATDLADLVLAIDEALALADGRHTPART